MVEDIPLRSDIVSVASHPEDHSVYFEEESSVIDTSKKLMKKDEMMGAEDKA